MCIVGTPVGNSVILLPTTGNVGSTVMMQPQPYILVNPGAEMPRGNPPPLIGPSVYCGNAGSGYILLSPNQNSLLQVVSSVPHSGKTVCYKYATSVMSGCTYIHTYIHVAVSVEETDLTNYVPKLCPVNTVVCMLHCMYLVHR